MNPISVYVHIPFCTVKCGYCDFNAYAGLDALKRPYREALLAEVRRSGETLAGRTIATIGFGGGTPGEAPVEDIGAVIAALARAAPLAPGAEVSLEVNPGTSNGPQLRALRKAGVTRLSIGAQSFAAEELRFLDRIHSPEATVATLGAARDAGFASVGLDLMYGLRGQTLAGWCTTLETATRLAPDHLSLYALTVEEGTPLARRVARGEVELPGEDAVSDCYEAATDLLGAAGYRQYELSNWARPGHESRHNQVYWRDGEYLGLGAGAHGYVGGERYENIATPQSYIQHLAEGKGAPVAARYTPDPVMAMADWVMLRLRLSEGICEEDFTRRFQLDMTQALGPPIIECVDAGVLTREEGHVRLTRRGRLLHAEAAARVLAYLRERVRVLPP